MVESHEATKFHLILDHAIHCGFETGLSGSCAALKPNVYYDDPRDAGRPWDIATDDAAEGDNYWEAASYNTDIAPQSGIMSIIPIKAGGTCKCDFGNCFIIVKVSEASGAEP